MRWVATRRGVRDLTIHTLAAFGAIAAILQTYQAIWDETVFPGYAIAVAVTALAGSVLYGLVRARPGRSVSRNVKYPQCRIEIVPGDLFDHQDAHLVIGFTDVFDTDVADDRVINERSVQGQFLRRIYRSDLAILDSDLTVALANVPYMDTVSRTEKAFGKLLRYPIGTVAVLGTPRRRYFCVAYSVMTPNLVAEASGDSLWLSLSQLWTAAHQYGQRGPLAMPVIGAGLARIDGMDRLDLIRVILLSFLAASRKRLVTTRLSIVVPPQEFHDLNQLELRAFLDSL